MKKRAYLVFAMLLILSIYSVSLLYLASSNPHYLETAENQQKRKISLLNSRGIIYDRNLTPLTNSETTVYAIIPSKNYLNENLINSFVNKSESDLKKESGAPFCMEVNYKTDNENIIYIESSKRYSKKQPASNIIGYLENGKGVSGFEKYAESILNKYTGELNLTYNSNSLGEMIIGGDKTLQNTLSVNGGIVLTIDKNLQTYTESAGSEIENGAIVIMDSDSREILSAASFPLFDSSAPEKFIDAEYSPFVNKCFEKYAPGSVFKLVIATAALSESDNIYFSPFTYKYNCQGVTYSDSMAFSCYGGYPHGETDLNMAITNSCNCYFMNISKLIPSSSLITTALNFGISSNFEIFPKNIIKGGNLPDAESLNNNRALSNFAIGQGEVELSPLEVANIVSTIASRGIYKEPFLYKGETYNGREIDFPVKDNKGISNFKLSDCLLLENYMANAVKNGTAKKGCSENFKTFAKTGTAQTGIFKNGKELYNYWYAGFIETPTEKRYAIAVLSASAEEGKNPTGEIFKALGEYLTKTEK